VAEAVGERCGGEVKHQKSVEQCKNKIDNLKKRYKVELQRIGSDGIDTSHWHWFNKIEAIVDTSAADVNSSSMARQTKNRSQFLIKSPIMLVLGCAYAFWVRKCCTMHRCVWYV